MTTDTVSAATNELEKRLLDILDAQQAAMLASSMAEAIALQELAKSAHRALQATPLGDPIGPIIAPLLRAVHGGQQPTPLSDDAQQPPKPRKRVPVLDGGEPVKRRKRKPTLAGVARQAVKAGIPVAGYEVRDGSIKVITGKPGEATTPDDNDTTTSPDPKWN